MDSSWQLRSLRWVRFLRIHCILTYWKFSIVWKVPLSSLGLRSARIDTRLLSVAQEAPQRWCWIYPTVNPTSPTVSYSWIFLMGTRDPPAWPLAQHDQWYPMIMVITDLAIPWYNDAKACTSLESWESAWCPFAADVTAAHAWEDASGCHKSISGTIRQGQPTGLRMFCMCCAIQISVFPGQFPRDSGKWIVFLWDSNPGLWLIGWPKVS